MKVPGQYEVLVANIEDVLAAISRGSEPQSESESKSEFEMST
jgi:hypothetical protein